METSVSALGDLFSAILDISKLDADVVRPEVAVFSADPLMRRLENDLVPEAQQLGLSFRCVPTSLVVRSDPVLVERILRNLATNAVRYTERGGVVIGCRRGGDKVRFEVWDTGVGIAADQSELIFQEFYQIGNHERDRSMGLGLGLAIVKRTAQLLGATLEFRSRLGQGSVFTLTVERGRADCVPTQSPTMSANETAHLLVLDDEAEILAAMDALLTSWGYSVRVAQSLAQALPESASPESASPESASPKRIPDLIISDFRLPHGETGSTAIEQLRAAYARRIPALIITGDTASDRIAEAEANGLLVLHKPVPKAALRAAVRNLLRSEI